MSPLLVVLCDDADWSLFEFSLDAIANPLPLVMFVTVGEVDGDDSGRMYGDAGSEDVRPWSVSIDP